MAVLGVQLALTTSGLTEAADGLKKPKEAADDLSKSAEGAQTALEKLKGALEALGVGIGFTELIRQADEALERLEKMEAQFRAVNSGVGDLATVAAAAANQFQYVSQVSDQMGTNLVASAASFVKLEAAARGTSLQGQGIRDVFRDISAAGMTMHLSTDDLTGMMNKLAMMLSTGSANAMTLRRAFGDMPGALQIAAQGLGMTTSELMLLSGKGMIPATEFLKAFSQQLIKTYGIDTSQAVDSSQASLNRLANAWEQFKETAGQAMAGGLMESLAGITNALKDPAIVAVAAQLGKALGDALKLIADGVVFVMQHLDLFKAALLALVAIEAAAWIEKIGLALQKLSTSNPYTAVLALVVALNSLVSSWRDSIQPTTDADVALSQYRDVLALLPGQVGAVVDANGRLSESQGQRLGLAVTALTQQLANEKAELASLTAQLMDNSGFDNFINNVKRLSNLTPPGIIRMMLGLDPAGTSPTGISSEMQAAQQRINQLQAALERAQVQLKQFQDQAQKPIDPPTKGMITLAQEIEKVTSKHLAARDAALLEASAVRDGAGAEQLAAEMAKADQQATDAANGITLLSAAGKKQLHDILQRIIFDQLQATDTVKNLRAAEAEEIGIAGQRLETLAKLQDALAGNALSSDAAKAAVATFTELQKEGVIALNGMALNGRNAAAVMQLLASAARDDSIQLNAGTAALSGHVRELLTGKVAQADFAAATGNASTAVKAEITYLDAWHIAQAGLQDAINQSGAAVQRATIEQQALVLAKASELPITEELLVRFRNLLTERQQELNLLAAAKTVQDNLNASRVKERAMLADTADWQTQQAAIASYGTVVEGILQKFGVLSEATRQQKVYEDALALAIANKTDLTSKEGQLILQDTQAISDNIAAVQRYQAAVEIAALAGQDLAKGWQNTLTTIEDTIANLLSGVTVNWKNVLQQLMTMWVKQLEEMALHTIQSNLLQGLLGGNVQQLGANAAATATSSAASQLALAAGGLKDAGAVLKDAGASLAQVAPAFTGGVAPSLTAAAQTGSNYLFAASEFNVTSVDKSTASLTTASGFLQTSAGQAMQDLSTSAQDLIVASEAVQAIGAASGGGGGFLSGLGGLFGSGVSSFVGAVALFGVGVSMMMNYVAGQDAKMEANTFQTQGDIGMVGAGIWRPAYLGGGIYDAGAANDQITNLTKIGQQFTSAIQSFFLALEKATGGLLSQLPNISLLMTENGKKFAVTIGGVVQGYFSNLADATNAAILDGLKASSFQNMPKIIQDYITQTVNKATGPTWDTPGNFDPQALINNINIIQGVLKTYTDNLMGAGASVANTIQGFITAASQTRDALKTMGLSAADLASLLEKNDANLAFSFQAEYNSLRGITETNAQKQKEEADAINAQKALVLAQLTIDQTTILGMINTAQAAAKFGEIIVTVGTAIAKTDMALAPGVQGLIDIYNQMVDLSKQIANDPNLRPGDIKLPGGGAGGTSLAEQQRQFIDQLNQKGLAGVALQLAQIQSNFEQTVDQIKKLHFNAAETARLVAEAAAQAAAAVAALVKSTLAAANDFISKGLDPAGYAINSQLAAIHQAAQTSLDALYALRQAGQITAQQFHQLTNQILQSEQAQDRALAQQQLTSANAFILAGSYGGAGDQLQAQFLSISNTAQSLVNNLKALNAAGLLSDQALADLTAQIKSSALAQQQYAAGQFADNALMQLYGYINDSVEAAKLKYEMELAGLAAQQAQLEVLVKEHLIAQGILDDFNRAYGVFKAQGPGGATAPTGVFGPPGGGSTSTGTSPQSTAQQLLAQYESASQSAAQAANLTDTLAKINSDFQTISSTLGNTAEVQAAYAAAVHDAIVKFLDPINSLLQGLDTGATSPLTALQQYQSAMGKLLAAETAFRSGDMSVIGSIPGLVNSVLGAAKSVFPVGSQSYDQIFAGIKAFLAEMLTKEGPLGNQLVAAPASAASSSSPGIGGPGTGPGAWVTFPSGGFGWLPGAQGGTQGFNWWTPPPPPTPSTISAGLPPGMSSAGPGAPANQNSPAAQSAPVVNAITDQTSQQVAVLNRIANAAAQMQQDISTIRGQNANILARVS